MARSITYYYPDESNPSVMKVYQDKSSQIRGFFFKRDFLKEIAKEEHASNAAVYFLFDEAVDPEGFSAIYVGQSKQGTGRIGNHDRKKPFWTHCIMFVSDNKAFDANAIDYMEHYFIHLLKKSSRYSLAKSQMRNKEPNVSIFDKTTYQSYIRQVEFLLQAEGVKFVEDEKKSDARYYEPKSQNFNAKMYFQDGKFIVESNSIIHKPKESLKEWSDDGRLYKSLNRNIDQLIADQKLEDLGKQCRTLVRISFSSPSSAAAFISGASQNGWTFFSDLEELRHKA